MIRTSTVQATGWDRLEVKGGRSAPAGGVRRTRYLYRGDGFALGSFSRSQRDRPWGQVNWVGEGHLVVFPTTSVEICVMSERPFLAGPNHVVLYNPGDQYKSQPLSVAGDRSIFMVVKPHILREFAQRSEAIEGSAPRFLRRSIPLGARAHLARWMLVRHLSSQHSSDPLLIEETCRFILRSVLLDQANGLPPGKRHRVVNAATALLLQRYTEPLTLDRIAKELFISPFHLARLFRAETGYTLHGYMTQLRLRRALDLLAQPYLDVNQIGTRVGFATHSHFTESFRKGFHVTPTFARKADGELLRAMLS